MQFLFVFFFQLSTAVVQNATLFQHGSGYVSDLLGSPCCLFLRRFFSVCSSISLQRISCLSELWVKVHTDTAKLFITWDFSSAKGSNYFSYLWFLNACFRFTLSCGTLLTTTLVFGPGSVSETRGHPQTHYGFLKGTPPTLKCVFCIYIYMLFVNLSLYFKFCLPLELLTKGILKLLWNLELHIYTMKDVSCWLVHVRD